LVAATGTDVEHSRDSTVQTSANWEAWLEIKKSLRQVKIRNV